MNVYSLRRLVAARFVLIFVICVVAQLGICMLRSPQVASAAPSNQELCDALGQSQGGSVAQCNGQTAPAEGAQCTPASGSFFGLDPWYEYVLNDFHWHVDANGSSCDFDAQFTNTNDNGINGGATGLGVIWLIGLAIFEDLLRVAGLVTVGFVLYGGIRYLTSQGEPENTKTAQSTIIHALIGLVVAVAAAATVSFLGNSLGG